MCENDNYIPKFAVIVRFGNQDRGYTISAESRQAALDKLVKRIDCRCVTAIHISEILLEEDEF